MNTLLTRPVLDFFLPFLGPNATLLLLGVG
jgi:hypothetical protein